MSNKIGAGLKKLEQKVVGAFTGAKGTEKAKVDTAVKGADDVEDNAGKSDDTGLKKEGDKFINVGAGSVGVVEDLGLKVPVTGPYQLKINDKLSRSSEPKLELLKAQGFHGVVNFQAENDDRDKAASLHLNELYIPITDNTPPTVKDMVQFLDFVRQPENQPCDVHCLTGRGRTGVAIACYRMAINGMNPQQALDEALKVGGKVLGVQNPLPNQREFILKFGELLGWVKAADGTWARSQPSQIERYPLDPPEPV